MDLSKFSYKKDESKLDAESPIHHRVNEGQTDAEDRQTDVGDSEANNAITPSNLSPNYQKGDSFREPSLFFNYLRWRKKRKRFPERTYK